MSLDELQPYSFFVFVRLRWVDDIAPYWKLSSFSNGSTLDWGPICCSGHWHILHHLRKLCMAFTWLHLSFRNWQICWVGSFWFQSTYIHLNILKVGVLYWEHHELFSSLTKSSKSKEISFMMASISASCILEIWVKSRIEALLDTADAETLVSSFRRMLRGVCDGEVLLDSNCSIWVEVSDMFFFLSCAQILWRWFQFLQLKYTEKKGGTYPEQIYHQDPAESHRISGWVNTDPIGHQCHRLGISAGMGQHAGIYGEGKCLQHLIMATVSLAGKPMDRLLVDEERQRFADFIQSSTQAGLLQLIL